MDGTLLTILSGRDRPGVTAALFDELRHTRSQVLDIQQLVVRGRLILAVLLGVNADHVGEVRAAAHAVATRMGMEVETVPGAREIPRDPLRRRIHVTVMSPDLRPGPVADLASTMAEHGWNIDRIRRIAAYPVTAVVFEGSGDDVDELRRTLAACSARLGIDISVQHAGLDRRGQRLVVMDVDSTLIQDEVIDVLAEMNDAGSAVAEITERAMRGDMDFAESLRLRVAALAGLREQALAEASRQVRFTPGARTLCRTLHRLGFRVCLVSGGFEEVVAPLAATLGVDDFRANRLDVRDGYLTGRLVGPIIDRAGKRAALEEFAHAFGIPLSRTIAIGDGANDLDMLEAAGLGVAFNAKPAVRQAADTSVNAPFLDSVLFLLGITRDEIEEADADQPLGMVNDVSSASAN